MPLRLDVKRQLSSRSDRVKSVDLHPSEPWILTALYNGTVHIWNYETQAQIKTFEVTDLPVRCARFVPRKNWVVTGSDDMQIRVFNYNTLEKVHTFEAHSDYIRSLAVHPTMPYLLSSSDDMSIKMWDWDNAWQCKQVFEGHTHYVMYVVFNPKDTNTFASCSLDRSIKVWQLGATQPNFTLMGHEKGVNCIDYFQGGDKPYLASGADDRTVKIWDYQSKNCVQTLEGHTQNVCAVAFHPELPVILTGSEDGTVRIWHSSTYRLENTLNYGMERVWCMSHKRGSNSIGIGFDEGSIVIQLGREEPAMSMDVNGKIIISKHNEVQQANLAKVDADVRDGETMSISTKDLGSCEIYPQSLKHSPNGRFVVVCGDGEYIIHTALSFRNKSFGQALEFVWAADPSEYATRESTSKVKLYKNFKEKTVLKPDFSAEGIFGGQLLGVRGAGTLAFYDWDTLQIVRRIEIECSNIFWSTGGDMLSIVSDNSFFVLKYDREAFDNAVASGEPLEDDGVEDAFEVLDEIQDTVKTGAWVGDCFLYTSNANRLNYYVGGEIVTVAHMDRPMYLLGYLPSTGRVYLGDKDLSIVSYLLPLAVLEYQTAVMRGDLEGADAVMPSIPKDQRTRVAHFLEKQGYKEQALVVSTDPDHRFELALSLHKLTVARDIAVEMESPQKWKQLADAAMKACMFDLADECLAKAQDFAGQLLLYTASGKKDRVGEMAAAAQESGKNNIAFMALLLQGKVEECIDLLVSTDRLPEATIFARTYAPSRVPDLAEQWRESLAKSKPKLAQRIANPTEYENLFPDFQQSLAAETFLKSSRKTEPASQYVAVSQMRQVPVADRMTSSGVTPATTADEDQGDLEPEPMEKFDETSVIAEQAQQHEQHGEAIMSESVASMSVHSSESVTVTETTTVKTTSSLQESSVSQSSSADANDDDIDLDDDFDLDDVDVADGDDIDDEDLLGED